MFANRKGKRKEKNKQKHKNYFLLLLYPYEVGREKQRVNGKIDILGAIETLKVKIGYWHF